MNRMEVDGSVLTTGKQSSRPHLERTAESIHEASETMRAAPTKRRHYCIATVPLRCEHLRQTSLFDERTYPLPKVLPGSTAVIVDSDEGWQDNFKRGIVTNYDFLTGLHTIQIESIEALDCYGREIRKTLR